MPDNPSVSSRGDSTRSPGSDRRSESLVINWSNLRPDEQQVLRECSLRAAVRGTSAVVLSALLTTLVMYGSPWRSSGSRSLFRGDWRARIPSWLRMLSIVAVSSASGYGAALSAVPGCIERILELPNSRLAAEVRLGLEDWQSPWSRQRLDLKSLDSESSLRSNPKGEVPFPATETDRKHGNT
ncbi:hypothetical protein F1559_001162 [Cyanidiococcus yangmingshanensis]|uniref:Uncharacterized protein n=1 Tax=Cyanidiococcus yangmingshanensis TaxID=2690220 RepID=A0A7J7IHD5_9RHOD|nr:hypothetical protein F1559_001162 [Cyanidiococcus yangmingshanensis]